MLDFIPALTVVQSLVGIASGVLGIVASSLTIRTVRTKRRKSRES